MQRTQSSIFHYEDFFLIHIFRITGRIFSDVCGNRYLQFIIEKGYKSLG